MVLTLAAHTPAVAASLLLLAHTPAVATYQLLLPAVAVYPAAAATHFESANHEREMRAMQFLLPLALLRK